MTNALPLLCELVRLAMLPLLSDAVAGDQVATPVALSRVVVIDIAPGQVTVGFWASTTVMLKVHETLFPEGSVAVARTVDCPMENFEPLTGVYATLTEPELSEADAV
jgi:hypothetical protein